MSKPVSNFKALSLVSCVGAAILLGSGAWVTAQQAQPGQAQPQPGSSKQPEKPNPIPRPSDANPRPADANPPPGDLTPRPTDPLRNTDPRRPDPRDVRPRDGLNDPALTQSSAANRWNRPFAFQNSETEGRFNENTRRLIQAEQRMEASNKELLRQLGNARTLSGPRQNEALMEVLQSMLQNQSDLQRYLVQSRSAWTGDMEIDPTTMSPQDAATLTNPSGETRVDPNRIQPREPARDPSTAPSNPPR